jgi:hypothetical protein
VLGHAERECQVDVRVNAGGDGLLRVGPAG